MANVAVRTRPVRAPVLRILRNGSVRATVAADVVESVRPGPVSKEIERLAEALFKRGLQRREERIAGAFEPGDAGHARQPGGVRTAWIHSAGPGIRLVDVARPVQLRARGADISDRRHHVGTQFPLNGGIELLHLPVAKIRRDSPQGIERRSVKSGGDVVSGKPCEVVVGGISLPENGRLTTKSYGGCRNWRMLVPALP